MTIRKAVDKDIQSLVRIEEICFSGDMLNRRAFRHLTSRANAEILVADENGTIAGYVTVLFRKNSSIARLYSIAVDPDYRKTGIARELAEAAENAALLARCIVMRLEIRTDNIPSLNLFRSLGYRDFDIHFGYYEDGQNAVRLQKHLRPVQPDSLHRVPYYRQTLNFTCGPASVMMAMSALNPAYTADRNEEIRIWRESTTIFMTSGMGGCGPHGLALAVRNRGFDVTMIIHPRGTLFIDSVRSSKKKEVISLVQKDFEHSISENRIPVIYSNFTFDDIEGRLRNGSIAVVLTTDWYLSREKTPHWVTITGYSSEMIWYHDPDADQEENISPEECMHIPMRRTDFEKICKYGRNAQKALLLISAPERT